MKNNSFIKMLVFAVICFMIASCNSSSTKKTAGDDTSQNDSSDSSVSGDSDTAGNTADGVTVDKNGGTADNDTADNGTSDTDNNVINDADTTAAVDNISTNDDIAEIKDEDTAVVSDDDLEGIVLDNFSFFVTSLKVMRELSGNQMGFGGDLRYGETGAGAGLRGADKICAAIAEKSMPGSSKKQWRAFLSVTKDETGKQVNAIDRIGEGPWYDRLGRLFAPNKAALLFDRPQNGDTAIRDDFPNEDGVPNHKPDTTQPAVDNHDFLTGTNNLGKLYSSTATCQDWTSVAKNVGKPRVGHSWPRPGGGGGSNDMANWMSALDEWGCAAGVHLIDDGAGTNDGTVGGGGGYGGFYCFALEP